MTKKTATGAWSLLLGGSMALVGCQSGSGAPAVSSSMSTAAVASAGDVVADGVQTATILVNLRGTGGGPIAGRAVRLVVEGGEAIIGQPGITDSGGSAAGTVASTEAGTRTITVYAASGGGEVELAQHPVLSFVGDATTIDSATSSVTAGSATVIADGAATSIVTITVRDRNGNPVAGQNVQLSASGVLNTIVQPGPTGSDGVAMGTIASTAAEAKTITAAMGSGMVVANDQPIITFVGNPDTIDAARSTVEVSPASGVVADGTTRSTITVTVRDANGNPVAGRVVQIQATGSNNTLSQPMAATDSEGVATASLSSTKAEVKTITATIDPGAGQVVVAHQPTIVFVGDPNNIDAVGSAVVPSPSTGVVADGAAVSTLTVTVLDANGNAVPGRIVRIAATGFSNAITQPNATDANGVASGTLASIAAGTKRVTVTVDPGPNEVVLAQQPTVTFTGDPATISPALSTASAWPVGGVVADGSTASTVTVTLRDIHGNPVPGQAVQLAASGSLNTIGQPGATSSAGVAAGTIATTAAESKTVTVTANPGANQVILLQQPTVAFVGNSAAISAGVSSVAVTPGGGVVADGTATSTITVTVRDGNGNPVAGQTVQLAATGTGNTLMQPSASTDANGIATGTIASTVAEGKTVTATVNPGPSQTVLTQQPTVVFVGDPSTIDASASTAVASPTSGIIANGTDTTTVTVTVRDGNGNPVPGQSVQLVATGAGNTLTQPSAVTGANGTATGTLAATVAESKTITATINPGGAAVTVTQQPTVTFDGDSNDVSTGLSTAMASPTTGVIADGTATSTITVTVRDGNGNPLPGKTVQLAATGTGNTLTQPSAVTDANGVTTGTIASTVAETKTITVTVDPSGSSVVLAQQPTVVMIGDASSLSAANTTVAASPSSGVVADGTATSTITVTVRDANGNPVPGRTVQLTATGSNNTLTQPSGVTDANGVATGTIASTTAETKTVTATIDPAGAAVAVTQQPTVAFVGDVSNLSASNSTAAASPSTGVVADGAATSTITVTVLDGNGNPVAGRAVQLAATGYSNSIAQPTALTDSNGVATGTIASIRAETKTITATIDPGAGQVVLVQQPTVAFVGDASNLSAATSTATASPSTGVVADGTTISQISVTVLDTNGNPVPGRTVQLSASGSNNTLTQPSAVTDANGIATGAIASTTAETKTITATVDPSGSAITVTQQPTVAFVGDATNLSAANSTASASPAAGVAANGVAVSTITVTVRDGNGNPVAGRTVQLAATGTNNTLTQPSAVTDANGVATGTIASTTAETKTITATVDPAGSAVVVTQQPAIVFVGDASGVSAVNSTVSASPSTGVLADGTTASQITVTVLDANGNPVSDQAVQLASTGFFNSITQPGLTDASGIALGSIASIRAETKTITATVAPGAGQVLVTQQPTVTFVGDPSGISSVQSTATASPTSGVVADGSSVSTITVTVRDGNGNPLSGRTVQLAASGSNNTLTQPSGVTDANGVATGSIASTTAETKTITVLVDPSGAAVPLVQQPTVQFVADLGRDDMRAVYGQTGVPAPLQRLWDDGASAWSMETIAASGSSTILWVADSMRNEGWYASAWSKRKKITVQSGKVSGSADLQNFPVLISLTDSELAAAAQNDGDDILFTAANGTTKLAHEIELYVAGTGQLVAWVKIPVLSPSVDTDIYLYYGNSSAASQQDAEGVWSDGFAAAWHLGGNYNGTANEVVDSTAGAHHGQAVTAPTPVVGKIGSAQDFEANNSEYLSVAHGGALDFSGGADRLTLSAWVRPESGGGAKVVLGKGAAAPFDQVFALDNGSPTRGSFKLGSSVLASTGSLALGTWHHLVATWDHATMRLYIDGAQDASTLSNTSSIQDTSNTTRIGAAGDGAQDYFDGMLDEVRIAAVVRSADWIATEFANQGNPATFVSVGSEEATAGDSKDEVLAVLADLGSSTSLDVLTNAGAGWSAAWTSTAIAQTDAGRRGFDVVHEDVSGRAIVVYSDGTATPVYRILDAGSWSVEQSLPLNDGGGSNPDPNNGVVQWIELVSRPGTDEIALAYSDANDDLVAIVWDGSQWLTATATTLETSLGTNAVSSEVDNRAFDLAYEWTDGGLIVAWARDSAVGFWYAILEPGSSSWSTAVQESSAPSGGTPDFVDLAAEPGTNRIACGTFDLGMSERLGLATWTGSTWTDGGEYDSQMRNVDGTATGDFFGGVAWVGESGVAVCVYSDDQAGTIDWARWTAGGGWVVQSDASVGGSAYIESVALRSFVGRDELMLLYSDSDSALFAATCDGSSWTLTNGAAALETTLSSITSRPFHLVVKRH